MLSCIHFAKRLGVYHGMGRILISVWIQVESDNRLFTGSTPCCELVRFRSWARGDVFAIQKLLPVNGSGYVLYLRPENSKRNVN